MKLKHFVISAVLLFFVILGNSVTVRAQDDEELKRVVGISVYKTPFRGSGGVSMTYFDSGDTYKINQSVAANRPIGFEIFAMSQGKALDYNGKISFVSKDVQAWTAGLGVQTKGFNKKKPFFGLRLLYTDISAELGKVPAGNNTGLDYMLAFDSSDKISKGTAFKVQKGSFGGELFAGYLFPVAKKYFLNLELGIQKMSKANLGDIKAGGHTIPCNATNGAKNTTCTGSSPKLDLDGLYIKFGFAFGK